MLKDSEKDEFIQLMNNRMSLEFDKLQWERLYHLLEQVLQHKAYECALGTSDDSLDIINDFFEKKLLSTDITFTHIGGFFSIFNNFCNDIYRKQSAQKRDIGKTDSLENKMTHNDENGLTSNEALFVQIQEQLEIRGLTSNHQNVSDTSFSGEKSKMIKNARNWLAEIEKDQGAWVTAYLGIHVCPSDEDSIPLNTLSNKLHLESYHYKAKKLGITGSKQGFWQGYKNTFIGKWMLQLGINIEENPISSETQSNMLNSLKILCEVALIRVTDPIFQKSLSEI